MRSSSRWLGIAAALALAACGGDEPPADDSIVVEGPAGRVVIERSPFALGVEDAEGRVALALAGGARELGDTLYAPLAWSTGDEPELAYPVLPGAPNTNPASPS